LKIHIIINFHLSSANCALEGELLHSSFFNVVNLYLLSICILHLTLIMKTIANCITVLKSVAQTVHQPWMFWEKLMD